MIEKLFNLSNKRFMWELIFLFTLILGLSITALVLPTYNRVHNQFLEEITTSGRNTVALAVDNVDSFFSDFDNAIFPITANYAYIVKAIQNERSSYADQNYLRNYLFSLFSVREDLYGVGLFIPAYSKCYVFVKNGNQVNTYMYYDDDIHEDAWYQKLKTSTSNTYIQPSPQSEAPSYRLTVREDFPVYHRGLPDVNAEENVAVLSLYLNSSEFARIANSVGVERGRACLLTDPQSNIYYASDPWIVEEAQLGSLGETLTGADSKDVPVLEADGDTYLCFRETAPITGLELVLYVPKQEIDLTATSLSDYLLILVPLLMACATVLIVLVSTRLTRPIESLAVHMKNFGEGSLGEQAEVIGRNEIAQLSHQFNQMVADTNRLMEESVQLKLAEKNAVIKALETETDPHYLYNTLQTIATLALEKNIPEVYRALLALSATYRFSLTGGSVVTLKHELEHVDNYVSIQKLRLQNRLSIQYEVDDTVLTCGIPKLAIQMLVENSIKHSMPPKPEQLQVAVIARKEGQSLLLSVRDNGTGIAPDRLEQIQKLLHDAVAPDGVIGLLNLCKRLKLLYGENAQIAITANENGTEVTLCIPVIVSWEELQA